MKFGKFLKIAISYSYFSFLQYLPVTALYHAFVCFPTVPTEIFFSDRIQSMGESNVFTGMCHSVHGGGRGSAWKGGLHGVGTAGESASKRGSAWTGGGLPGKKGVCLERRGSAWRGSA